MPTRLIDRSYEDPWGKAHGWNASSPLMYWQRYAEEAEDRRERLDEIRVKAYALLPWWKKLFTAKPKLKSWS